MGDMSPSYPKPRIWCPTEPAIGNAYVHDAQTGVTELISVTPSGAPSTGSDEARISPDGNYVAFSSNDPAFVPGNSSGLYNVFLRDRAAGTTTRVSMGNDGEDLDEESHALAVSSNGRYVFFGVGWGRGGPPIRA